jgi:hypothetical protein
MDIREKLLDKVALAQERGMVVDVSHLTPQSKMIIQARPTTARSTKRGNEEVPIISDNYQSYLLAMTLLGDEYLPYAAAFRERYGNQVDPASEILMEALAKAETKNMILDVSHLRENGTNYKIVSEPKTDYGAKKKISDLALISDNYEGYKLAVDLLGPDYQEYAEAFLVKYGVEKIMASPKTSPKNIQELPAEKMTKKKRELSPPRQPQKLGAIEEVEDLRFLPPSEVYHPEG